MLHSSRPDFFGEGGRHIGLNKARSHGIHRDSPARQLPRRCLGKADDTGFGGRIVGLSRISLDSHHGGHVDDTAASLSNHLPGCVADAVKSSFEVHIHNL